MGPYGEECWLGVFSDPKPSYSSFLSPSAIIQLSKRWEIMVGLRRKDANLPTLLF
jgi:hypothetical protein